MFTLKSPKQYLFASLLFAICATPLSAQDGEPTTCAGVAVKEDGGIVWPSPETARVECYPNQRINDSRIASMRALQELLKEFGLNVTVSAMPIKWQIEDDGPHRPAWEVYVYSVETGRALMLFLITSETGYIKKLCDNRFEDQHCKSLAK